MPGEISKIEALKAFDHELSQSVRWYKALNPSSVVLIHHNDTDGLSAGSICARTFERAGARLARYCLEKPYPEALTRIFEGAGAHDLVILTDLASGMLGRIGRINTRALPVLVLDHHRVDEFSAPWLCLLNTTACGLDGTVDGSASSVAYSFALALSNANQDLKALALLGAFGDAQFTSKLDALGLNARHYFEPLEIDQHSFRDVKLGLDVLGSYAYFRAGPDIALKILSDGFTPSNWGVVASEIKNYQRERDLFITTCALKNESSLTSFELAAFPDAGVKMVGLMCEELLARAKVGPQQYLLGFQALKDQIPGLGTVGVGGLKVSMRVGSERWQLIRQGKSPDVATVLTAAANAVNGFVDGCHRHAGAVTIPVEAQSNFLAELKRVLAS